MPLPGHPEPLTPSIQFLDLHIDLFISLWGVMILVIVGVAHIVGEFSSPCLLYTSDAADDMQCVDLGGRRIIKK